MNLQDLIKWGGLLKTVVSMLNVALQASGVGNDKAAKAAEVLNELSTDITGYIKAGAAFDEAFAARVERVADDWEARTAPLTPQDFITVGDETRAAAQTLRDVMAARRAG